MVRDANGLAKNLAELRKDNEQVKESRDYAPRESAIVRMTSRAQRMRSGS